jgi:hypothetical protein
MIQNVLTHIGGVGTYGVLSVAIFFATFLGILVWVVGLKKSYVQSMGGLPLEDEPSEGQADQEVGVPSHDPLLCRGVLSERRPLPPAPSAALSADAATPRYKVAELGAPGVQAFPEPGGGARRPCGAGGLRPPIREAAQPEASPCLSRVFMAPERDSPVVDDFHEPHPPTPSLSPGRGEAVPGTGEGDSTKLLAPLRSPMSVAPGPESRHE